MTKLQTVLSLAKTNNIVAIWKMKITLADLEGEIGETNQLDRDDLKIVESYLRGRGAKPVAVTHALERLNAKAERNSAKRREQLLEQFVGVPHVEDETVLVASSAIETKPADPKAELVEAARLAAAHRGEICRVGNGTNEKALTTYVEKRVPSATELTTGKAVKLSTWQRLHASPLARAKFAKAS